MQWCPPKYRGVVPRTFSPLAIATLIVFGARGEAPDASVSFHEQFQNANPDALRDGAKECRLEQLHRDFRRFSQGRCHPLPGV